MYMCVYRYFYTFLTLLNFMVIEHLIIGILFVIYKSKKKCNKHTGEYCISVFAREYMALVVVVLSCLTAVFVTTLYFYHTYFASRNMSTYANLKMNEVFILFANPFSRRNCRKNMYEMFVRRYQKRIDFHKEYQKDGNRNGVVTYHNSISAMWILKNGQI